MHRYIMRACVAAATGVALSIGGVTGASASGAAPQARQAVRGSAAETSHVPASPGTQLWVKRYDGSGGQAYSAAVSPSGRMVYVTGSYATNTTADAGYATIAYSATTGAQLWVARYNGGAQAYSVAVSPSGGTVFVTGYVGGTSSAYATVAYNAATGAQLWVKLYRSASGSSNEAFSLAVSPSGSMVFVTGQTARIGPGYGYATVAYNAATGAQLWAKTYYSSGNQGLTVLAAASVAVSPSGSTVFVTGEGSTSSQPNYATVAYNAATGAQLWVKRYCYLGSSVCQATSVVVSPSGGMVFVTGYVGGTSSAYATIAYNAATGAQLWVKVYKPFGGGGSDAAYALAVSPSGSTVFVTGGIYGGGGEGDEDYATVAYSATTGAQLWVKRYNLNGGTNYAYSVALSPSGSTVYVTGGSEYGYATVAYNAATGTQLWVKRYNGTLNYENRPPAARSVAVSPTTGTVFVTGYILPVGGSNYGYTTIAYSG